MKRDRLDPEHEDYQSRSEVKRDLHELFEFGHKIYALPKSVYAKCPVPKELDACFKELKRIKSNNAQKRQWQHIAKVLRQIDIEPMKKALKEFDNGRKRLARDLDKLEILRDDLLNNKEGAFDTLINEHPDCDIQQLRQIIRAAQKEKPSSEDKKVEAGKNFRKLFQSLKDLKDL
ncbi:MAG: DUF615 domain-containing protein [Pseudomonadales bacterium]|nr:DUF615 domain-containing protein [Pseudomonadales bacterium]